MRSLEEALKEARDQECLAWVVVESVYSMDGDTCPLKEVLELAKVCCV